MRSPRLAFIFYVVYNVFMKICKKLALMLALLILTLFPVSCGTAYYQLNFISFNSAVEIKTYLPASLDLEKEIKSYLYGLENTFSLSVENSLLNKYNALPAKENPNLTEEFKELLTICKNVYNKTNGAFDPTVLPLTKLWQFSPDVYKSENFEVPSDSEIKSAKGLVSFNAIENGTFIKTNSQTILDLGGVVKGYGAEKIAKKLINAGAKQGYVDIGGSSFYLIEVSSLGIRHPRNDEDVVLTINKKLKNVAVSTSGDYEKFYEKDGKRYCHIINPKTGYPTNTGFASVTILGSSGAELDALSTALMTYEEKELIEFIKQNGQTYSVIAVYINGQTKQIITNLNKSHISLKDKSFEIVKV